ncbi:KamA family radical SAM protein [Marimonas lutisalis]|uniref:KamA family radical SAM protein n=1 Tax=Marimonas lutisalis TaxID=2545756 RepID=UPI0010F4563A|nr:lysine 2,3-aminomutase [Marimonas lutisalis]
MRISEATERYKAIGADSLHRLPQANRLPAETRHALKIVSKVLPFRVNAHVTSNLIDWDAAPDDPVFRLVFPAREMLSPEAFTRIENLVSRNASSTEIAAAAREIRAHLNPHPSGQREHNVPELDGAPAAGFQHKYKETVLYFPARGQTCHAYCTFCFRWAQFVGNTKMKFASKESKALVRYLRTHPDITDVLFTGGDPMIMATHHLAAHIEPLLAPEFDHIQTIRIGTKSLTFWPQRYVSDPDADELLRLIERVNRAGRNVAVMAHVNHWRELDHPIAHAAIRRLRDSGAIVHSQGPLLAGINDDPDIWARNWRDQVRLGVHPYYMFIERDTGPRQFFEVPLSRSLLIYRRAIQQVSGLARSARGPVMSAAPGKVEVIDTQFRPDRTRFLLQFLQARDPSRVRKPFWAEGPHDACWFDQLETKSLWNKQLSETGRFPPPPQILKPVSRKSPL